MADHIPDCPHRLIRRGAAASPWREAADIRPPSEPAQAIRRLPAMPRQDPGIPEVVFFPYHINDYLCPKRTKVVIYYCPLNINPHSELAL